MLVQPHRTTLFPYTTLFRSYLEMTVADLRAAGATVEAEPGDPAGGTGRPPTWRVAPGPLRPRSEEHTSELQSLRHLVCRLLLEKKKNSLVTPAGLDTGTRAR